MPAEASSERVSTGTVAACGYERWPVKTLTDRDASKVNFREVVAVTVVELDRLPILDGEQDTRGIGFERTVFRVRAYLVAAKVEADSDIHLVLRDLRAANATMIAELPAFGCTVGAKPLLRKEMQRARVAFVRTCGDPGNLDFTEYRPGVRITLTGVGFFDRFHGQRGVAPNVIELHPVLSVSVSRCR
jgi:hypothetical protein